MAADHVYFHPELAEQLSIDVQELQSLGTHEGEERTTQPADSWLAETLNVLDDIKAYLKTIVDADVERIESCTIKEDVEMVISLSELVTCLITNTRDCVQRIVEVVNQTPDAEDWFTVETKFENIRKSEYIMKKFAANLWDPYSTALIQLKGKLLTIPPLLSKIRRKSLVFLWHSVLKMRFVALKMNKDRRLEREYILESTRLDYNALRAAFESGDNLGPCFIEIQSAPELGTVPTSLDEAIEEIESPSVGSDIMLEWIDKEADEHMVDAEDDGDNDEDDGDDRQPALI